MGQKVKPCSRIEGGVLECYLIVVQLNLGDGIVTVFPFAQREDFNYLQEAYLHTSKHEKIIIVLTISQMLWSKNRRYYTRFQQFEVIQIFQFYKLQDFTILVLTPKREEDYNKGDQLHTRVDMNISKHCHISFRLFLLLLFGKRKKKKKSDLKMQKTKHLQYISKAQFL